MAYDEGRAWFVLCLCRSVILQIRSEGVSALERLNYEENVTDDVHLDLTLLLRHVH